MRLSVFILLPPHSYYSSTSLRTLVSHPAADGDNGDDDGDDGGDAFSSVVC